MGVVYVPGALQEKSEPMLVGNMKSPLSVDDCLKLLVHLQQFTRYCDDKYP